MRDEEDCDNNPHVAEGVMAANVHILILLLLSPKVEGVAVHAVLLEGPFLSEVFIVINCGELHKERILFSGLAWPGLGIHRVSGLHLGIHSGLKVSSKLLPGSLLPLNN